MDPAYLADLAKPSRRNGCVVSSPCSRSGCFDEAKRVPKVTRELQSPTATPVAQAYGESRMSEHKSDERQAARGRRSDSDKGESG